MADFSFYLFRLPDAPGNGDRFFVVDPRFIKSGLKSTRKSQLTLPSNSGLRTNWDKFGPAQETEINIR